MASTKNCSTGSRALVLIDGECLLCNRLARFVIRRDVEGTIRFAALGSAAAVRELSARDLPPPPPGTFVLVTEGRAFYRSEAALRLMGLLPFPWNLLRVLRIVPRAVRDAGYLLVARLRYRVFGRVSMCGLLTEAEKSRFLNS